MPATHRELDRGEHPAIGTPVRELDPGEAWRVLMGGGWIVHTHTRGSEACSLVVSRPLGGVARDVITAAELRMAARRARGVPLKVLGLELGRSPSCAASRVAGTMRKLGFASMDDLVGFFLATPSSVEGGETHLVLTYKTPPRNLPSCLSTAERRVVNGLMAGRSQAAIARDCGIACRTVANHVASVHRKLGVQSRIELLLVLRQPPEVRQLAGPRRRPEVAKRAMPGSPTPTPQGWPRGLPPP